jgi:VWFA-related protein
MWLMNIITKCTLAFCLTLSSLAPALGQTPAPPGQQQREELEGDDVVRITTNLVQFDAVVTDGDGRQVTNLTADDFEIREDGRPKRITSFSYVELYPGMPAGARTKGAAPPSVVTRDVPPPTRLRADKVRRAVALVVDDGYMSFGSLGAVREALKKFVAERYEPNDLIGVFRTGGGNGLFQQFTSDRNQLALAVSRLDWRPGDHPVDIFEPTRRDLETVKPPSLSEGRTTASGPGDAAAVGLTRRAREPLGVADRSELSGRGDGRHLHAQQ